jgi:simple sugar transport system permease protein
MSSIASPAAAHPRFTFSLRELIINYGILALLFALIVFFSFAQPAFFRVNNIFSILQAVSITALLGVGVTVTLIAGGFDLSVGGLSAFVQMAAAYVLIVLNGSTGASIVACLGIGLAVGLLNATLIVWLGIPDLLATLGMLFLLAGFQLIPTGGRSIAPGMTLLNGSAAEGSFTEGFYFLGRHRFWDVVPVPVVVLAVKGGSALTKNANRSVRRSISGSRASSSTAARPRR